MQFRSQNNHKNNKSTFQLVMTIQTSFRSQWLSFPNQIQYLQRLIFSKYEVFIKNSDLSFVFFPQIGFTFRGWGWNWLSYKFKNHPLPCFRFSVQTSSPLHVLLIHVYNQLPKGAVMFSFIQYSSTFFFFKFVSIFCIDQLFSYVHFDEINCSNRY